MAMSLDSSPPLRQVPGSTTTQAADETIPPETGPPIPPALLLLSDSALPLGSFAYSSGLESFIAHESGATGGPTATSFVSLASFHTFLALSLASVARNAIPFIIRAHRHPEELAYLDNDIDAMTLCPVSRRASVAQGLALMSVWERSFRSCFCPDPPQPSPFPATNYEGGTGDVAGRALRDFSISVKQSIGIVHPEPSGSGSSFAIVDTPNGHYAPLWGAVTAAMSVSLHAAAYIFLYNHAKGVISAAVRASVMGPYQSQAILADPRLQAMIMGNVRKNWTVSIDDAGQVVPVMDLWVGRHELLYSRIFNS